MLLQNGQNSMGVIVKNTLFELQSELISSVQTRLSSSLLGQELISVFMQNSLQCVFQPIVDLQERRVYAFEALVRGPNNSVLYNPLNLFNVAEEHNCLFEIDSMARMSSIQSFSRQIEQSDGAYLFLNISINSVLSCFHKRGITMEALETFGLSPDRVVIEITELQPVEDFNEFVQAINYYRELGFKVAIDDLGSGYNGLRIWSELKPDFVKIDRHFVTDIHLDADKKRFMETLVALASGLNTKVVVEGVELEEELHVLESLNVDYIQGYLFKKPVEEIGCQLDYQWPDSSPITHLEQSEKVVEIVVEQAPIEPDELVDVVAKKFLQNPEDDCYPVVSCGRVLGMVWRRNLMNLLARKFGPALLARKTVEQIMDDAPLVVEYDQSLVNLSRTITNVQGATNGDAFIVTCDGNYLGCGQFKDLLRRMTDLKVQSAQYANPLSGLPGNVPIQNAISKCLTKKVPFEVIYIDVDHFKPYNDYYSFEQGDEVIRLVAQTLKSATAESVKGGSHFIGHIGGDDFVVICSGGEPYTDLCTRILQTFQEKIGDFYNKEDRLANGILTENRKGERVFFPVMSLSLGVVLIEPGMFDHTQKIASLATKAKKGAKAIEGNSCFVLESNASQLLH